MRIVRFFVAVLMLTALSSQSQAAIFSSATGDWPKEWGDALEPLRATSRTIGVGTGIQENIYEMPIADRETFDRVWPAVLKLLTPGGRVTLTQVSDGPDPAWGEILNGKQATIRIYGPSEGYTSKEATDPNQPVDYEQRVKDGKALKAGAPWPPELVGKDGALPEYVVGDTGVDGRMTWTPADPYAEGEKFRGFYHRARIDVELVIDGEIIDLNELKLPDGSTIKDQRFAAPK